MGTGWPLASPADPTARTHASARCPAPQLDDVPGEGVTGDGGCRGRWPHQLPLLHFPLIRQQPSVMAAKRERQSRQRTGEVVSSVMCSLRATLPVAGDALVSFSAEPSRNPAEDAERQWRVPCVSLPGSVSSDLGSRSQPVSEHLPAALKSVCVPSHGHHSAYFILRCLCRKHSNNFCPAFLLEVSPDLPTAFVPRP